MERVYRHQIIGVDYSTGFSTWKLSIGMYVLSLPFRNRFSVYVSANDSLGWALAGKTRNGEIGNGKREMRKWVEM